MRQPKTTNDHVVILTRNAYRWGGGLEVVDMRNGWRLPNLMDEEGKIGLCKPAPEAMIDKAVSNNKGGHPGPNTRLFDSL